MELKKSYKGFIIWLIAMCVAIFGCVLIPTDDAALVTRIVMNTSTISLAVLTWIVYKTENVYWYNGISYEEARKASSDRRKLYAWTHCRRFGMFALVYLLISVAAHMLQVSFWLDIVIGTVGLIVAALGTIKIKL